MRTAMRPRYYCDHCNARIPLTNEGVLTVVQALPGGAAGFGDQWRRTAGAIGTNLDALPKN